MSFCGHFRFLLRVILAAEGFPAMMYVKKSEFKWHLKLYMEYLSVAGPDVLSLVIL